MGSDDTGKGYQPPISGFRFGRDRSRQPFVYRASQVIVDFPQWNSLSPEKQQLFEESMRGLEVDINENRTRAVLHLSDEVNPVDAAKRLRSLGVKAQVNHVFFANSGYTPNPGYWLNAGYQADPGYWLNSGYQASPGYWLNSGYQADPGYWLNGAQGGSVCSSCCTCCSADEVDAEVEHGDLPEETNAREACSLPDVLAGPTAEKVSVLVLDTSRIKGQDKPTGGSTGLTMDSADSDGNDLIDPAAGHGIFVSSIIQRRAQSTSVSLDAILGSGLGELDQNTLVEYLEDLAAKIKAGTEDFQIINMSFSGYTENDVAPLGLTAAIKRLSDLHVLVVASAGNEASARPAYPAATKKIIAVGALAGSGPAAFTNFGPWVDACAQGVDIVSTFPSFTDNSGETHFANELASWSGTSFSAPLVTAALARCMAAGNSAEEAATGLISDPRLFRFPGLGAVINLL